MQEPRDPSAATPQFPHRRGAPGLRAVFARCHVHGCQGAEPTICHRHQEHGDGAGSCPAPCQGAQTSVPRCDTIQGTTDIPHSHPEARRARPAPSSLDGSGSALGSKKTLLQEKPSGKTLCKARRCWAAARWAKTCPQHPPPRTRGAPTGATTPRCRQGSRPPFKNALLNLPHPAPAGEQATPERIYCSLLYHRPLGINGFTSERSPFPLCVLSALFQSILAAAWPCSNPFPYYYRKATG